MNRWLLLPFVAAMLITAARAQEKAEKEATPQILPVAILPFAERGAGLEGSGRNVADILFANLSADPSLILVERQELDKILAEAELNLSGAVQSSQAIQIGQLTGAKILVTGSVFRAGADVYVVAKVIGTETSRVIGKSVNGPESVEKLAGKLAGELQTLIAKKAPTLVASQTTPADRLSAVKEKMKGKTLPSAWISIKEQHVNRHPIDPAAETEMSLFYSECGGTVLDAAKSDPADADIRITGEAVSEFSTRLRNLVSVKARLEVKVLNKKGEVIAVDRQTVVAVDLNEIVGGKSALQQAAAQVAERLIPKLAK